jgi:hypothetical protein
MTNFQSEFMKSMGPQVSKQLAGTLGIKKQTANQIIPDVLPLILGGLFASKVQQDADPRLGGLLGRLSGSGR